MKKIINIIFPYQLYLHIFQLEGYRSIRALRWIRNNFFVRFILNKKPLVYTKKAKIIQLTSVVIFLTFVLLALCISWMLGLVTCFVLIVQPYILIIISILIFKPYEFIKIKQAIRNTRKK